MSLYTFKITDTIPSVKLSADLQIEECSDVELLSTMGTTTVKEVVRRLANDHVAFVAYVNNLPAAFGWMARGKAFIGELNHEFILPYRHRYLWNFRTKEAFRGLGIYPALLQRIIELEESKTDRFWIIHAPENEASLRGIQKVGFRYVGKLYNTGKKPIIERTVLSNEYEGLLNEMDIEISSDEPVSCWNCSSPYLKKRVDVCCCSSTGKFCVASNLSALTR
jgi:GNAT superfamily N-acetyltransferase